MAALTLRHVQVHELGPYLAGLRQLEAAISYPLDDGREQFRIDHGPGYADFFSGLGEAHFAIACDGDQVVGALAGVLRQSRRGSRELASVYLADLKVAAAYRGKGLGKDLLLFAVGRLRDSRFRRWRLAFGAAMRGARGDVMNSARGFHPARLGAALARLHVYFVPPQQLATLRTDAMLRLPPGDGLDLSPQALIGAPAGFVSTAGRKDLRLLSTGDPWLLWHLPHSPAVAAPSWLGYLAQCGAALSSQPGLCCFALDGRLVAHVQALAEQGITPGSICTVYGLALHPAGWRIPWLHLSTAEI